MCEDYDPLSLARANFSSILPITACDERTEITAARDERAARTNGAEEIKQQRARRASSTREIERSNISWTTCDGEA